jgi:hypothetical protein
VLRTSAGLACAAAITLLPSCAPAGDVRPLITLPDVDCGWTAVRSAPDRMRPPACATPEAETVARMCAIHDRINERGYMPSPTDEEGNPTGPLPPPLPFYVISNLRCTFTDANRNAASCGFVVSVPGEAAPRPAVTTQFVHYYWREDGPTSHMEGVMWRADEDCTPEVK